MAWTPVSEFNRGDRVTTTQGSGYVVAQSAAQGTVRIKTEGGGLIEVPKEEVRKTADKLPEGIFRDEEGGQVFKTGDKVMSKRTGKVGTVSNVTQRTIWVKGFKRYPGEETKIEKRNAAEEIKKFDEQPKAELKDGDRVRYVGTNAELYGKEGRYIAATSPSGLYGSAVEFDEAMGGHDANGKAKNGHGWFVDEDKLEKLEDTKATKVGDKVKLIEKVGGAPKEGDIGTVIRVRQGEPGHEDVTVDFPAQRNYSATMGTHTVKVEDEPEETKEEETKQQAIDKVKQTGDNLYDLSNLQDYLEKKVDSSVDSELKELRELAKKNQKLEIKIGDETHVLKGTKHNQLETLITYSGLRMASLLVGMAGTGKTHAAQQVAEALGLSFYAMSVGAQTSKSDIIGYMDASGNYVKTFFRDAYEKGGVFLMDEIDAGNANVLIQVNAALSNGLCAFPDAMVKQHEDFVFIASANTYGNGANRQYVGRNQLDAATLDRFAVIDWRIDDDLEAQLAVGKYGAAWYKAVTATRKFVADKNIRALISPRATQKGSKLLSAGVNVDEVISSVLLSSVPDDKRADVIQVAVTVYEKEASGVPSTIIEEIVDTKYGVVEEIV